MTSIGKKNPQTSGMNERIITTDLKTLKIKGIVQTSLYR